MRLHIPRTHSPWVCLILARIALACASNGYFVRQRRHAHLGV